VHDLSSTAGVVALAAAGVAAVSMLAVLVLALRLRRLRTEHKVILGDGRQDLVAHAAGLESRFEALSRYVEDAAARLDGRMRDLEERVDGALAYRSLLRYDAYGEMSGRQSTSIALLDATQSGIVLSSIHHRDQARLYAKQIHEGLPELQLSPEEEEAVRLALTGERPEPPAAPDPPGTAGRGRRGA
jgi:hypothetical protein